MNLRIEKLNNELSLIPSTNKKKIGTDGFKNEYFYFQDINNKVYVKHPGSIWNEFTSFEDIEELISSLTEKANNEKSLISKLNKVMKKGKFDSMDMDEENVTIFTWTNGAIKTIKSDPDEFNNLADAFDMLEEKISDYLYQDSKEWESFDNRQQLVKYINSRNLSFDIKN
jgi:hypothetical protein